MRVRRVVRGGFLRPNAYGHTTHKSTRLHMNGWRWYHVCIRLVLLLNANASNYFIFRFVVSLTLSTIFILISFLYFEIFVFVVDSLVGWLTVYSTILLFDRTDYLSVFLDIFQARLR